MDLLLWRHAEAVDGVPDSTRELSERGLRQAHKMAEWLDKRRPKRLRRARGPPCALGVILGRCASLRRSWSRLSWSCSGPWRAAAPSRRRPPGHPSRTVGPCSRTARSFPRRALRRRARPPRATRALLPRPCLSEPSRPGTSQYWRCLRHPPRARRSLPWSATTPPRPGASNGSTRLSTRRSCLEHSMAPAAPTP